MRMLTPVNAQRLLRHAAVPVGMVASAGLVWNASYSAFSATTDNPSNSWATGTVALSDDDSGSALFSASNLRPGSTGSRCITVTSSGTLPSAVKLYGSASSGTLGQYIDLVVEEGSGATAADCTGFTAGSTIASKTLSAFATSNTDYASGVGSWTPSGSGTQTRSYRFSYTVKSTTPNTAQGTSASLTFTWEAQNS